MSAVHDLDVVRTNANDASRAETWRLSREIAATRGDLDRYLGELGRRRHEMTDVRLQARRHPGIVVALGAIVAAAVGGALWKAHRARKQKAVLGIGRALLGNSGGLSRRRSGPPPRRIGGRLLGFLAKAAMPLGVALAKSLLRRAADTSSPASRRAAA